MKTEATGTTSNTVDTQQAEGTVKAAETAAADGGKAAEAEAAAEAPKDSVEHVVDEPADELGGKDNGRKPKPAEPKLTGGVDVETLLARNAGTTVAEAEDLTGERGGKVRQVAEAETLGRDSVKTLKAGHGVAEQVVHKAHEGVLAVEVVDTAQAMARTGLRAVDDAAEVLEHNKKIVGKGAFKFVGNALSVANDYQSAMEIKHDIENGGLSTDSVVPLMDIGSDLAGKTGFPLAEAWSLGWSIGRTIDGYTGASDKASDLAAYGTTKPWAGTVKEGREKMRAYEKNSEKIRAKVLARHRAAQIRAEQREIGSTPKSAKEAPRLDASNTEVDSSGRVYVDGQYRGYYVNGRFIVVNPD